MKVKPLIVVHHVYPHDAAPTNATRIHWTRDQEEAENWCLDEMARKYRRGRLVITDRRNRVLPLTYAPREIA